MDEKMREKVHALAKSLKDLHLVASMDEAVERAKAILSAAESNDKPVKDLLGDLKQEVSSQDKEAKKALSVEDKTAKNLGSEASYHEKDIVKNLESAKADKEKAKFVSEQVKHDIKEHKLEKGDVEEAMQKVEQVKCAVDDAKFIVDEADKVQKKPKKEH